MVYPPAAPASRQPAASSVRERRAEPAAQPSSETIGSETQRKRARIEESRPDSESGDSSDTEDG